MNSDYFAAQYMTNAPTVAQAPPDYGSEVAFAGRSNSGKSSTINALTRQKQLARVSKTPGRTQQLVFFEVTPAKRLVDLPGYGYAKVPLAVKAEWQAALEEYLMQRHSLKGLILVTDIRQALTEFDDQMLAWCQAAELPVHVLLNKSDKLTPGAARQKCGALKSTLLARYPNTSIQNFSATAKQGLDELHATLDLWLKPPVESN